MGQVVFIGVLAALSLLLGFIIASTSYNFHGYVLVALALCMPVLFIIIPRTVAGEKRLLLWLLIGAFFCKAGASLYRIIWGFDVKGGHIDAGRYDRTGRVLVEGIWQGDFGPVLSYLAQPGTHFVEGFTGIVYAIIGPTLYGGFLLFATFVFIASCLYYRAFRIAFPTGNRLLFFGLIFFYPSWLYWPSSIGKDALMALGIGLVAYGAALFLRQGKVKGLLILAIGLSGAFMVRPHIAAMVAVGLGVGILFRPYRLGPIAPLVQIAMVAAGVAVSWIIINHAATYVRLDEVSLDAALAQYEVFQENADGGSAFEPVPLTDPLGVPVGILTILYRPFPWEAHRGAALVLSLEGVFLLALTIRRFGSIKGAILSVRSDPYLIFILVYTLMSILVFTSFGNFSIVGRQRLQFLPLFFMLLAYQPPSRQKKRASLLGQRAESSPPVARGLSSKNELQGGYGS